MPEDVNTTPAAQDAAASGNSDLVERDDVGASTSSAEAKTFDEKYVRELRAEAAKYRKELQEVKTWREQQEADARQRQEAEALQQGKYKELLDAREKELTDLRVQIAQRDLDVLKMKIANEYSLPPALASRLQGTNEDELKQDAEALKAIIPPKADATADAPATPPVPQRPPTTTPLPGGQPSTNQEAEWRAGRTRYESPIFSKAGGSKMVRRSN